MAWLESVRIPTEGHIPYKAPDLSHFCGVYDFAGTNEENMTIFAKQTVSTKKKTQKLFAQNQCLFDYLCCKMRNFLKHRNKNKEKKHKKKRKLRELF